MHGSTHVFGRDIPMRFWIVPVLFLMAIGFWHPSAAAADKPNVLLIAIDDLNDWVSCLGGHPNADSPSIDALAERGTLFTNAHCQAPICNPSRTSIMYGMRPSTTGIYNNAPKPWTVAAMKNRVTLPRHFAANGYKTYTAGKIYHGSGLPDGDFAAVGPRRGQKLKIDKRLIPPTDGGAKGLWDFGGQDYDEELFQDFVSASYAIKTFKRHPKNAKPFFLAVGFYRPHVPFYSPSRIFDRIPIDKIALPVVQENDRDDLPAIASQICKAPVAPPHAWFVESGNWRQAVKAYLACIRWTDEQVGRIIDALDKSPHADNTIIVLYSDHGFFLGEKERWAKQAMWERATKVPFIIATPKLPTGQRCGRPVELLSIYPTLIDLCGLTPQKGIEGRTLKPLLENATAEWPHPALTTHGKNNHSVRTERYRYIRYRDGSEELYDAAKDPNEWTNLASRSEHTQLKKRLATWFPKENADPAKADPASISSQSKPTKKSARTKKKKPPVKSSK